MQRFTSSTLLLVSAAALLALAGCQTIPPVRSDAQIASDIQAKLSAQPAFSGAGSTDVHVTVSSGVATLSGPAPDDNTRRMAATYASKVDGVKELVNDMTLLDEQSRNRNIAVCAPPRRVHRRVRMKREHAPELASSFVPPAPEPESVVPPPAPAPAPLPPPPAPAFAPPTCVCVPMVVLPAPIMVPVRPLIVYGFAPVFATGAFARPGWVSPFGSGRSFAYARPGVRVFVR